MFQSASHQSLPILAIAGPTASGKSALCLRLAQELRGAVVSIDSVQVYRGADIGSAKASSTERRLVPHYLIDICAPHESYDAARCCLDIEDALEDCQAKVRRPILCVGTTMYLTSFLHGLVPAPKASEALKLKLSARETTDLYTELQKVDPKRAGELHPNDRVRISRSLEMFLCSGQACSEIRAQHAHSQAGRVGLIFVLIWEREKLYQRINSRSQQMVSEGLLAETEALLAAGGRGVHALRTLGYAQALEVIEGRAASEGLAERIAQETRRFAKRQMTYWRNEPAKRGWPVFPPLHEADRTVGAAQGSKDQKGFGVLKLSFSQLTEKIQEVSSSAPSRTEVWYLDAESCLA